MLINKGIVLYGAGVEGNNSFLKATEMNIPIKAFVDQKAEEKKLYKGIEVVLPQTAYDKFKDFVWIVAIGGVEKEIIYEEIIEKNIEVYKSLEDYYIGEIDYNTLVEQYGNPEYNFPIAIDFLASDPLVYSFGVGADWSFEKELQSKWGGSVYMFDPSPSVVRAMEKEKLPTGIFFQGTGLSDTDGIKRFYIPNPNMGNDYSEFSCTWTKDQVIELQTQRLTSIMENMGHTYLNLLKIDIEGSEFFALPDILKSNIKIDQICMETHARAFPNSVEMMHNLKNMLNKSGFLLVCNTICEQTYISRELLNGKAE